MSPKTLLEYEAQWKRQINSSCFLGEITLDRETLDRLCNELGTNALENPTALTVLAVNCAYYYMDYDGFWPHFCDRLGVSYSPSNTGALGSSIEGWLNSIYRSRRIRIGTYRYVGAILEHCGVTRKHLPGFTAFLKGLHSRYGWDGILGLDYRRYSDHIPTTGSRYLQAFLRDQVGWEFVRDVARNLSQRDRGLLDTLQLETLGGYHPSFWGELSALMQLPPPKRRQYRMVPVPVLMLDAVSRSIQIRLDPSFAKRSAYRLDRRVINSATISIRKESDFRSSYDLEIFVEDTWLPVTLSGWLPQNKPFAFFHETKGYIGDPARLKPGVYFLAATREISVPAEMVLARHGTLSLFCGYFQILEVLLTAASDLTAFNVLSPVPSVPYLSYMEPCNRLASSADRRLVFTNGLPTILVNNLPTGDSARYVIVAEVGGCQKRVGPEFLHDTALDLEGIGFKFPCQGALWIEATRRSMTHAGEQVVDRMDFAAIRNCSLDGPNYLISNEEEAELSLKGPDTYWLDLEQGKRLDEAGTKWVVGADVNVVEGTLWADKVAIRIAYRFFRANLYTDTGCDTLFSDELDSGTTVHADGVPRTPLGLYLSTPQGVSKLGVPGDFDTAGHLEFTTYSFRDAILAVNSTAGRFEFGRPGSRVATPMFFMDMQAACDSISLVQRDIKPLWLSFLSPTLQHTFDFLYSLAVNDDPGTVIMIDRLPRRLLKLTSAFIGCARVLDGRTVPQLGFELIDHQCQEVLDWYIEASAIIGTGDEGRARELVESYPGVDKVPVERWKSVIEEALNRLKREALHFLDVIEEWANEVRGVGRVVYAGQIASVGRGKDLIESWRLYYCHGKTDQAFHHSSRLIEPAGGIITDLARLLTMLSLVKFGQKPQAAAYLSTTCNPVLSQLCEALAGATVPINRNVLGHFPIREEDYSLFGI